MRRKWIIPLVLWALLLVAWFFRWEQGPTTQLGNDLKIVHTKDRWTGQAWIVVYGNEGSKMYSGEMIPVISTQQLEKRKAQILPNPGVTLKTAEDTARSEMKTWAWQLRKIATGVWAGLLAVAAVGTIFLYRREAGQKPQREE